MRFLALLVLLAAPAFGDDTLRLAVGQEQVLPAEKVVRLSVADPGVASASLLDGKEGRKQVLLTALKPGRTDLLLWEDAEAPRRLVVQVAEFSPDRFGEEIRDLTQGIEGLVIRSVGEKVVLDGKLLSARDKERVDLIAKAYPQILNLTTVDLGGHRDTVAGEIRRRVGSRDLRIELAGGKALLKGTVPSAADRTAAEQIAQAFYPEVTNQLEVAADMLEIDVTFARVEESGLEEAGQNLPASIAGTLTASGATGRAPAYAASATAPLLLKALESKGKATILASPHLSTASGSEASFHSGGEQGYRVSGTGAADMKFKKHGLLLKARPVLLPDGRVRTALSIEVSAPAAGSPGGDPAFTTFTTESEVVTSPGEAVVVSGLVESLKSKFREKTPILGDIPVLKAFFGASRQSGDSTRLLVVLAPHRASGAPTKEKPFSEGAGRTLEDARQGP